MSALCLFRTVCGFTFLFKFDDIYNYLRMRNFFSAPNECWIYYYTDLCEHRRWHTWHRCVTTACFFVCWRVQYIDISISYLKSFIFVSCIGLFPTTFLPNINKRVQHLQLGCLFGNYRFLLFAYFCDSRFARPNISNG